MNVEDLANAGYVTEAEGEGYDRKDEMKQEAVVPAPPRDLVRDALQELVEAVDEHLADKIGGLDPYKTFGPPMRNARAALSAVQKQQSSTNHGQAPKVDVAEVVPRADEQDARRYRWLRLHAKDRNVWQPIDAPERFDAAVDAAMGDTPSPDSYGLYVCNEHGAGTRPCPTCYPASSEKPSGD